MCVPNIGMCLFNTIYRIRSVPPEHEIDFTDRAYQVKLPLHARSTASQAVKNNIKLTEILANQSLLHNQEKVNNTPAFCSNRYMIHITYTTIVLLYVF